MLRVGLTYALIFLLHTTALYGQWAVVCVPVADALVSPAYNPHITTSDLHYPMLTLSSEDGSLARAHQLLYNERVKLIAQTASEALVELTNIVYNIHDVQRTITNRFWLLRSTIQTEHEWKHSSLMHQYIPTPLVCTLIYDPKTHRSYSNWNKDSAPSKRHIVLTAPWYNESTNITYSVGTRFVRNSAKDSDSLFAIYIIDWRTGTPILSFVPQTKAWVEDQDTTQAGQARLVGLIRSWLSETKTVPYVWGGSSLTTYCNNTPASLITYHDTQQWYRQDAKPPFSGFDCSELIWRSAQICGLPYPCKTSSLIPHCLARVTSPTAVEVGDIVWYPGHVMIVSNLDQHKIIEVRGYSSGYGKLHEIPLSSIFTDIPDFDTLISYSMHNRPCTVRAQDGTTRQVSPCRMYRLSSLWYNS